MPLNVLIVGCGAVIEELYKSALKRLTKKKIIEIIGLVDPNHLRATRLLKHFPAAKIFTTLESALSDLKVHLSLITSPPAFHCDQSIQALKSESHVLCEKPMAVSVDECRRMIETANTHHRILALGMTRRYYPSFSQLKSMVLNGSFPGPYSYILKEGSGYQWPVMTTAGFERTSGGGILTDIGSHDIDLISWFFGPPTAITCSDDAMRGGVETNCRVHLKNEVSTGFLHLSWDHELPGEFRIKGATGEIIILLDGVNSIYIKKGPVFQKIKPIGALPVSANVKDSPLNYPKSHEECIYYQLVNTIRSIEYGDPLMATGEDGLRVLDVLSKCYTETTPMLMPWLKAEQRDRYTSLYWKNR